MYKQVSGYRIFPQKIMLSEYDNLDLYQIFINVCQVSERVVRLCDYISITVRQEVFEDGR